MFALLQHHSSLPYCNITRLCPIATSLVFAILQHHSSLHCCNITRLCTIATPLVFALLQHHSSLHCCNITRLCTVATSLVFALLQHHSSFPDLYTGIWPACAVGNGCIALLLQWGGCTEDSVKPLQSQRVERAWAEHVPSRSPSLRFPSSSWPWLASCAPPVCWPGRRSRGRCTGPAEGTTSGRLGAGA